MPTATSSKKIKSPVKIKPTAWTETDLESPTKKSPSENVVRRTIEFSGSAIVGGAIPKKKKTKTKGSKEELKIISDSTLEATDLKTPTENSPTENVVRSEVAGSESIGGATPKKKKTKTKDSKEELKNISDPEPKTNLELTCSTKPKKKSKVEATEVIELEEIKPAKASDTSSETESPKKTKLKPEIIEDKQKLKKTSKSNSTVIEDKTETKSKKKSKVDAKEVIEFEVLKPTKASDTSETECPKKTKLKSEKISKPKSTDIEDKTETKPKKKSKTGSVDKLIENTNKVDTIALKDILDTKSLLDGSLVTQTKKQKSKTEVEIIDDVAKLKKTSKLNSMVIEDKPQTKPKKTSKAGAVDSDEASVTQTKKKKTKIVTKSIESTVEKMIDENLISESSQRCELLNVESIKSNEPSPSVIKSEGSPSEIVKNDIKIAANTPGDTNIEIKDVEVNSNNKIIEKGMYIVMYGSEILVCTF